MNSRQRVLSAINHQQPDRVPIDLGGTRQSGIAASTYHALKQRLGINTPTQIFDCYQMLAEVERPVMERFGADIIGLNRPQVAFGIDNSDWKPWTLFDGTPVEVPGGFHPVTEPSGDLVLMRDKAPIARMPKNGFYFDRLEKYPGAAHLPVAEVNPPLMSSELAEHYRCHAEALWQNTDFAIVAPMGPPYELFFGLGTGDFSAWMMTLATEPDYVDELLGKLTDLWITNLSRFADAVQDRVPILQICDDFGMQHAPFLSPKMFRERIMPFYQRGIRWIHENTEMKVLLHSDGALRTLIPSLIEMGVDILNPVQTSADGMDGAELKAEFGSQLVFWGGSLDCQHTLPFGTIDEVVAEVTKHVSAFAAGGGYVFAPVHNIQASVPIENMIAMYDTAIAVG
ncbi:uroporphyrinogen decarboxylase family protein [Novipirellula artificiosorum]|uniref:Methylcobalamin:coenzyme M methyltransferase n=1 Tax=Novipirellula artificiosorum TaxID=2528016 RepID=A0A5C6DUZ2_9BACT|nr:uroporphyrinogen decarboxylase family protein [Novipirellula artificiosorum]TWU40510.1 methylcobalamin:coenzyme M methyltransferase [Novipirellula artificiosorum]